MKFTSLRDKFKSDILVRPLYRKSSKNRVKPVAKSITIDVRSKLCGRGTKNITINKSTEKHEFGSTNRYSAFKDIVNNSDLCNNTRSEPYFKSDNIDNSIKNCNHPTASTSASKIGFEYISFRNLQNMKSLNKSANDDKINNSENNDITGEINDKHIQTHSNVYHAVPITWLRFYPAPATPDEGVGSLVFRCLFSQFGLIALLSVWTLVWWIVICYLEEPYEQQVTQDFEKEQNQLVIDLATELRQISKHSLKWRPLIEARIQQERILTLNAAGRGVKLNPGAYWDLSGTFLFTIFVMTALGFGAPVPQTIWGRTSAIVYAVLAVPTHLYLMMNLSTCIVFHMETLLNRCRNKTKRNNSPNSISHHQDDLNARNEETFTKPFTTYCCRRKIRRILSVFCVGRGTPLAITCYYAIGALCFGYLRNQSTLDIVMFPCLFTTTGGLETVKPIIRVIYGLYVEGALLLVSIALAVLKFHNNDSMDYLSEKYRLYVQYQYESQRQ